jgi:hypothetical protein
MSMFVLWVVMLCGLVGRYQRFLHLQGWSHCTHRSVHHGVNRCIWSFTVLG